MHRFKQSVPTERDARTESSTVAGLKQPAEPPARLPAEVRPSLDRLVYSPASHHEA